MAGEHDVLMEKAQVTPEQVQQPPEQAEQNPPEQPPPAEQAPTDKQPPPAEQAPTDEQPPPAEQAPTDERTEQAPSDEQIPSEETSADDQNTEEKPANGGAEQKTSGDKANSGYNWKDNINHISFNELAIKQSVVYDEGEGIRCSPLVKDGKLMEYLYEDARTQHECFLRGLRLSNGGNCLGYRPGPAEPYKWLTYQQILDRAQHAGSGLIAKGAKADQTQFIGIYSQNRIEWSIVEQACNAYSMVSVPLYDTLGPQAMKWIIQLCKLEFVVVDKNVKAVSLLNDSDISLKLIVLMEEPSEEVKSKSKESGIDVITFSQLEELGKEVKKEFVPPSPEDIHTICFTSGTTGNPKGAVLTHRAVVADTSSILAIGEGGFTHVDVSDVHLSYLPLAHMFEKVVQCMVYTNGASIGFFQGDVKLLLNDLAILKPSIFPMVPRLMNRVYDKIMAGASQSTVKKFLLDFALKKKMSLLKKGIVSRSTIWDKLVFKKVQNLMGGNLRLCVTGAAPISPTVLNFMRCALGVPFTEGYGQTEATAGISVTIPGDYAGGNVGAIVPGCLVKLVDVPEKNYFAKDGKGEVCAKGPILFSGYYNDPEKTKQAVDKDGWLHTGDVGQWLPNGSLKIFDRSKHIFKLAQGEYIAPEKIEQIYVQSAPVAQVFLHGESLKASLVVIVVPDPETAVGWCKSRGITCTYEQLCSNVDAEKLILEDMNALGKKNSLFSFELAKKIHLSPEQFSVENELLTPTFKSRRPQLFTRYEAKIKEMYQGLD